MSIDWSKAPSSATHYLPEQKDLGWEACWYKKDGDKWLVMNCARLEKRGHMEWIVDYSEVDKFVPLLVPRSAFYSEWNGQGLPPVGTVCERRTLPGGDGRYEQVRIIAHTRKGFPVWENTDGVFAGISKFPHLVGGRPEFRPIRTPEQIAADERSKECDRIFVILSSVEREGNRSDMAEALYDAGYRRQEEGK
ncbi:hypothetical protein ACM7KZ_29085 [Pseudomonas aeruginosa]